MKKKSKKLPLIAILGALLIGFTALIVHNYKTKTSFKHNQPNATAPTLEENKQDVVSAEVNKSAENIAETRKNSEVLKVSSSDIVFGDRSAPVVIIEFASLSCPHCAAFHREAFDKLKSEYIDAKKVQFIHRSFPLNQPALMASMFADCQARQSKENVAEKYYSLIKALFKTQDSWAFDAKYVEKLQSIAQLDGMSSDNFNKCINDKSLQERILKMRMETAKSLQIQSTPTFFINGEIMEGYVDYLSIKKIVDKNLAEQSSTK